MNQNPASRALATSVQQGFIPASSLPSSGGRVDEGLIWSLFVVSNAQAGSKGTIHNKNIAAEHISFSCAKSQKNQYCPFMPVKMLLRT